MSSPMTPSHPETHRLAAHPPQRLDASLAGLDVIEHPLPEGLAPADFLALMALPA